MDTKAGRFDFGTQIIRSGTGSAKWTMMEKANPDVYENITPLSIADMEFMSPPCVYEGLKRALDSGIIMGYTRGNKRYYDAVVNWFKRRHGWDIESDWIIPVNEGVIGSIHMAVEAFADSTKGILLLTPIYTPLIHSIEAAGCRVIVSELEETDGRYEINREDFADKAKEAGILILCSPHNPAGRVWTEEEINFFADTAHENGMLVLADEIHHDLVLGQNRHTVYAKKAKDDNWIIFTAPSKTFNLAGMTTSNIIAKNAEIRKRLLEIFDRRGFETVCNTLGLEACRIAYEEGDGWLNELLEVLDENRKTVKTFFAENMPEIRVFEFEGTYLMWLDFRKLGLTAEELEKRLELGACVFLNQGYKYGEKYSEFVRMNIACPTAVLKKALVRIKNEFC